MSCKTALTLYIMLHNNSLIYQCRDKSDVLLGANLAKQSDVAEEPQVAELWVTLNYNLL